MTENLLIQIKNGIAFEHPMTEESLRFFIHNLDINNPPEGYARFVRKPYPQLPPHQQLESVEYVLDSELSEELKTPVWTDKFNIRELSEDEIIKITSDQIRSANEKMKESMGAPYSAPDDGKLYLWSKSSNTWVIMPYNIDEIVSKLHEKLEELGLSGLTPDELENIDEDLKQQLKQITDQINIS